MNILRNVGACLMGLIVGSAANMALILLATQILWPTPPDLDMSNAEQMTAYVATLPVAALLLVIVAHLAQAFVGGWVAARLSAGHPMALALTVGVLTLLGGVVNMLNIGGPAWMWIETPLYMVVAFAAGQLEVRRRHARGQS